MTYDLIIQGGTIVDGSGNAAYRGDIAIKDGVIAAIGAVEGSARETIDASGALVTPGFVDIHCHYDGQVSWDPDLMPSSVHGVTTAVMGSCGVGFAPVHVRDRTALIELMEGVEDIPGTALAEGINWRWESFEEYLDAIDDFPHAIDFAAQVPHDSLRVYVMGERALAGEEATDEDIATMRELTRRALEAGAVGFSTGRTDNHRAKSGAPTPASEASIRELQGIAEALHGLGHGVLQAVSDFDMPIAAERFDPEFDVIEAMAAAGGGHRTSISLLQRDADPEQWRRILDRVDAAKERGIDIRVQVAARGIGVMLGFEATFHPFMGFPSYKKIAHLPLAERVAAMRTDAVREAMLAEKSDKVAGDGSPIPPLADRLLAQIDRISMRLFRLGEDPNYEPAPQESLFFEAKRRGITPLAAIYDALLEDEGHQLLYFPIFNYGSMNLDNVEAMLNHPQALPGLSDGGAHVGTICDASFPTFMLTHWVRDRARGRLPVEKVIKMMTRDTAEFIGFHDRGELAVGKRADINVIDLDHLRLHRPRLVRDLPAGGQRLLQDVEGYRATLVAGQVIAREGKLTGARPGRLARLGARAAAN
ncbi:MAG: amidohydrolase family protein [Myxococcales bacterium]|nr:amidohydrolase family protein [Myxococcales bacterium]